MVNGTVKLQGTVNGQTVTFAELALADFPTLLSGNLTNQQAIAFPLTRPIKVDAGTAINLVVVTPTTSASFIASATVHTISQAF